MIRKKVTRQEIFNRRAVIMGAGQLGLFGLLIGRLQYLQLRKADEYAMLAEDNRVNVEFLSAPRGRIVDRQGNILARNDPSYQLILIPEQSADVKAVLRRVQNIVSISDNAIERILKRVEKNAKFVPITIADNISWDDFSRLNLESPFLPGVQTQVGEKRIYLYGEDMAHMLGYVGAVQARSTQQKGKILEGRSGLEYLFEENLQGVAGNRRVEVNAYGRIVRELEREKGKPGAQIQTTLDTNLQTLAIKSLGNQSGAAVVLDIATGGVLALASTPSYDPNQLSVGIDDRDWAKLTANEKKPLMNKAISGLYSPGSTFKMVVALAALDAGVVTKNHKFDCPGSYTFGGRKFHCWERKGHGVVDMRTALARSCDVYFYDLALRIGIDQIQKTAREFGFGEHIGLGLMGERDGVMPGRTWKEENLGRKWQPGETVLVGIGQGYILASPLQLAVMTARLASRGVKAKPHVILGDVEESPERIEINDDDMDVVLAGMNDVVNHPRGTAFRSRIWVDGKTMAGKTGTVQVRTISEAERSDRVLPNSELPWHLRDHAIFVGYAPVDNPRYAVAVLVEHGGGGSTVAAPIGNKILTAALEQEPIMASKPSTPKLQTQSNGAS
ncbi:penicillin-binding protein 2 [Alphaproteobacteria bacterium]|nr:penicillin-binding protein 2 [Alphaproteobacteria bacterium]